MLLDFIGKTLCRTGQRDAVPDLSGILDGFSLEVMPRTAARVASLRDLLPAGTRVYIAHIDGTSLDEMLATARRVTDEGLAAMVHIPARMIAGEAMLADWLARYRDEAGVREALVLAGGIRARENHFTSSMELLETGLFDRAGFTRLHVAGHPEGNADIDPMGGTRAVDEALAWKAAFRERTDAEMAIVTQFVFEAAPLLAFVERIRAAGIGLPVYAGVAGPAKLQTLLKYAVACGVGPSLKVLQRRAADVGRLLAPYEPTDLLADLARAAAPLAGIHVFPFGGIEASARWATARSRAPLAA